MGILKSTALIIPLLLALTMSEEEMELATSSLRAHGYTLFPNAVATSDLRILLVSNSSNFTLFSPPDPLLYSLDFTSPAHFYVHSLLSHVSPTRIPFSLLRSLPFVDTLLPGRRLVVQSDNGTVLVDGVRVSDPDLFVGSGFVVHGLQGILVNGIDAPATAPSPLGFHKKRRHRHVHHNWNHRF